MLGAAAARRLPDYPRRSRLGGLDSDGSAARDTRRNHADMNEPKFIYTASFEVTDPAPLRAHSMEATGA